MAGQDAVERLRAICLALPEAAERETWGVPTFRVRDKIFAMSNGGDPATPSFNCKAPAGVQQALIAGDPARFYKPAYVGSKGWIGVRLDGAVDWDEVAGFVADSYRMTAPKKLGQLVAGG